MLSEQQQLSILAQSNDATAIYDSADLRISFVNEAMLRIWGKRQDVTGKTFEEALPEMIGQPFTGLLKSVWHTGIDHMAADTPATLEINGKLVTSYFDFEYRAIKDTTGNTVAILHTARDVTARYHALLELSAKQEREKQLITELTETAVAAKAANTHLWEANSRLQDFNENMSRLNRRLLESETHFKRLVEQAPVAILVLRGPELVIDMSNEAMLAILDKDSSIIGQPLLAGMPELKNEPAVELLFDAYHSGKSFDGLEAPVRMKRNGNFEVRYFNFSYRPLTDHGDIIGVMDVAVEVTEQVLARKTLESIISEKTELEGILKASRQHLQGILDTMAEGVIIVDGKGKATYANAMAQKIMGFTEAQLRNRRYNDPLWKNVRTDGTTLPKDEHPVFIALHTGQPVHDHEVGIVLPGNKKIYVLINAAPLFDEQHTVTGGIVTFMDVTNRRKILQQKDDFISVASHELKTPVTSLKASIQLLENMEAEQVSPLARTLVRQAGRSMEKLNALINSLLTSDRIGQGRFNVRMKRFNIVELINDCCQHVRVAGTHEIIFNGNSELEVVADEQLIDQVMVNLVNNAVKYAPGSKRILIDARRFADHLKISVTDFGPGIPTQKLEHLFDRYYQGEPGGKHADGLGLGLYISKEIIENHGGSIGVDSEPGKGSTFWFTLPDQPAGSVTS